MFGTPEKLRLEFLVGKPELEPLSFYYSVLAEH
jgi:hypothetical protein